MTQAYLANGRTYQIIDASPDNLHHTLPAGTYSIAVTPRGFHLERLDNFDLPAKLYGDVDRNAERILNTFRDRPSSTGVLLSGQKGSGKTMLSKRISQIALAEGMPTIVINDALFGEQFNSFLQAISQPCVVIFDEFEKVYDREEQRSLLTIFDGTYPQKKLFILTCNDRYRIDGHMHNRPGRLYYSLDFSGLDREFVESYCRDNLKNLENLNGVMNVSSCFGEFSFDMLKALVEEMNRYNETATQVMELINVKPQSEEGVRFKTHFIRNGVDMVYQGCSEMFLIESPLSLDDFQISVWGKGGDEAGGDITEFVGTESYTISAADIVQMEPRSGTFVFRTHRPDTLIKFVRESSLPPFRLNYDLY